MTMNFVKKQAFYETPIYVRAYAKLRDGSIVYSDTEEFSVFEVSSYLYDNGMMLNPTAHDYLYDNSGKLLSRQPRELNEKERRMRIFYDSRKIKKNNQ